jgi:hypothetical protein
MITGVFGSLDDSLDNGGCGARGAARDAWVEVVKKSHFEISRRCQDLMVLR